MSKSYLGTLEEAPVIDEDNVGSQILKSMGWTPGTGLGARNQGRISPVRAVVRPKRIGSTFYHSHVHVRFLISVHYFFLCK